MQYFPHFPPSKFQLFKSAVNQSIICLIVSCWGACNLNVTLEVNYGIAELGMLYNFETEKLLIPQLTQSNLLELPKKQREPQVLITINANKETSVSWYSRLMEYLFCDLSKREPGGSI